MEFTGERFVPINELMKDEIAFEHFHRYHNALKLVEGKVVLDIACGEGYGTKILSQSANKVFGVDIDEASIEHAKRTYSDNNVEFIQGSVDSIPLPDNSVDVVISYETIEHIDENTQNEFLKEIKRVLANDGIIIISTPDKANYSDRYSHKNEFHVKEFEKDEFISFLKKYFIEVSSFLQGYEIVDAITGQNPTAVNELTVVNWQVSPRPFSRKYVIALCSDGPIKNLHFSSVVFQVSKDYLELMDGIVQKEAHIIELGNWGKTLDKEIEEKNDVLSGQRRTIEEQSISLSRLEDAEVYFKDLLYKQTAIIENLSSFGKEREQLKLELDKESTYSKQLQEQISLLRESYDHAENKVTEKNKIVVSQNETITFLKSKIEEYSQKMLLLGQEKSDKEYVIKQQKEKEQSLHLQWEDLYTKWNNLNNRLSEIYNSEGWKLLDFYYKIKGKVIPENSKRYVYLKRGFNWLRGKKEGNHVSMIPSVIAEQVTKLEIIGEDQVFDIIEFKNFQVPVVSIIIPVFNGWAMTYKCLRSIYENTIGTEYEIIIADDGASDQTKNISDYIKNIIVIRNKENLGFLKNCNNAAKAAKGKFVLFLNNDTEVRPRWLSSLVDLMERDNSIGMAGSKFIYPDGRLQEAGGIVWKDASAWNFGNRQLPDSPEFNYVKEVDYISGACILVRADLWNEIDGFDTRYSPAYYEDTDLAFAIRKRGYKVVYQPLSEIIHFEGFSNGTDQTAAESVKAYQALNKNKFYEKWREVLSVEHFTNAENVFWARDRSRNKKTILVIDHYVPHHDKDAGSRHTFQYLKLFLSLQMNVKFIGDNFFKHEPYTTDLLQLGIEVLYGNYWYTNWKNWILENKDKIDYVLLNRPHISIKYIDFFKENTNIKIIYFGHDLHYYREEKQYLIEKDPDLLKSSREWKKTETYLFEKSDIILTPSKEEEKIISASSPDFHVFSIPLLYFTKINPPVSDFSKRKDLLFVGGFSHKPNVDAVLWFSKEVFPLIRSEIIGIKFIIVGSNLPDEIKNLASADIVIKGFLSEEQLNEVYSNIRITVIPLRYGAGVKGKTLEAMHNGIPLVTTSFGIEGLPGAFSFIEPQNTTEDFAREVIKLYSAPNQQLVDLSKKEIEYISDHFCFDVVKKEFQEILSTLDVK